MTAGKVTGGGFVADDWKTSFGFSVRSDGTEGKIELHMKAGDDQFKAESLTSLSISGNTATWVATGSLNGSEGYRITITVVDVGPPKKGSADLISILIEAPNGSPIFSTSAALLGGNIVIH